MRDAKGERLTEVMLRVLSLVRQREKKIPIIGHRAYLKCGEFSRDLWQAPDWAPDQRYICGRALNVARILKRLVRYGFLVEHFIDDVQRSDPALRSYELTEKGRGRLADVDH